MKTATPVTVVMKVFLGWAATRVTPPSWPWDTMIGMMQVPQPSRAAKALHDETAGWLDHQPLSEREIDEWRDGGPWGTKRLGSATGQEAVESGHVNRRTYPPCPCAPS